MNSANYIKVNVILVIVLMGLSTTCKLKADQFAGRKGVPVSGYTQIAPGQYMQNRNYSASYSGYSNFGSYGGITRTTGIKPWKSSSQTRSLTSREKMLKKIKAKKAALKAKTAKRTGRKSNRIRLARTSSLR